MDLFVTLVGIALVAYVLIDRSILNDRISKLEKEVKKLERI